MGSRPLSVVLATKDRPDPVASVLRQVLAQLPADGEVVVVDQSAPEASARVRAAVAAFGDARARVTTLAPPSLPAARNLGVAATSGAIVLFLDDDVVLHEGLLAAHLTAYTDRRVGGVVGRIVERNLRPNARRTRNDIAWDGRIRTRLDGRDDVPIGTLKGANMSFRRVALEQIGGFDEGFAGTSLLEDADASTRAAAFGWRLRYVAGAAVDHAHLPTGGVRQAAFATKAWRFHNTGRYLRKHRGLAGWLVGLPTHSALAWRHGGTPGAAVSLLRAYVRGARSV